MLNKIPLNPVAELSHPPRVVHKRQYLTLHLLDERIGVEQFLPDHVAERDGHFAFLPRDNTLDASAQMRLVRSEQIPKRQPVRDVSYGSCKQYRHKPA